MKSKKVERFATVIFLWPVYFLSYLIPRSKHIWVFGSFSNTFADNSKYLFLQQQHLSASTGITPVWITKSKELAEEMRRNGYKSYRKTSLQGAWYCLRASVYVYSWTVRDINFWLSGGAHYVSLWHGIPFKKIGPDMQAKRDLINGKSKKVSPGLLLQPLLSPSHYIKPDVLLSTYSNEISGILKRVFPSKQVLHSVYPRVEHFLMPEEERTAFIDSIRTEEEKKLLEHLKTFDSVWVYMPTFRDNKEDKAKMYSQEIFDFEKLNPILQGKNVLLLVKYHYVVMRSLPDGNKYSNVLFLNSKMDMYVILPYTSGLITDYSSIFFDYMLLQKPMLFYVFDIESYQNRSRDFYYPYEEAACGVKVNTFPELCRWFELDAYKNPPFDYRPYIKRFWGEIERPFLLKQLHQLYNRN